MVKDVYDILNDVTIDLEALAKDAFDDIEKKHIKSRFKKSINKNKDKNRKSGIISAAIVCAITVGILGSVFRTSIAATIKLASVDIASFLGLDKNLDMYKTVVGQTKSSDGISIQLNEVVLNGNELVVSTTTKYEKDDSKIESISPFGEIFINEKKLPGSSSGIGKLAEDSTFQDVMTYNLKDNQLKGDLDIKIVYSSVLLNGKVVNITPRIFKFTTNGDELLANTIDLPINHSFTLENGNIVTLNNYVSNVIDKKIFFTIESKNKSKVVYSINLRGYDNYGNEIVFEPMKISEKDGILKLSTVTGQNISDKATEITLIPYATNYPEENGNSNNTYKQLGEKFTIKIK